MTRNDQQPTCKNAASGNQTLTIKYYLEECPQWRNSKKNYNIQSDTKTILEKGCELEKMRFSNEIEIFEEM